jgi:Fe-S-cluster containining protein
MAEPGGENIQYCIRCGTCCMKGGPTVHHEDKEILLHGHVGHEHLVTVRTGETVYNPVSGRCEAVSGEMIKVRGKGREWACFFYDDSESGCSIYEERFLECSLLKCWDPSGLMSVIGKNTIVRADIINRGDPIMSVIEAHDRECSCIEFEDLISAVIRGDKETEARAMLGELIRKDMSMRAYSISELGLKPEFELFIFGRPLSQLLEGRGLSVSFPKEFTTRHPKKSTKTTGDPEKGF